MSKAKIGFWLWLGLAGLVGLSGTVGELAAQEKVSMANYYDSVDYLVNKFRRKFKSAVKTSRPLDARIPIVSFGLSEDLSYSVRDYALQKLESVIYKNRRFAFKQCKECLVVRATMVRGEVFVAKGVGSNDELDEILADMNAASYAEVMLVTSKPFLKLLINIYTVENKVVLWKGEFRIRSPQKSTFVTHSLVGYSASNTLNANPITFSTFLGEKMFQFGEVGFENLIGAYYQPAEGGGDEVLGVVFQFGAKVYFDLWRLIYLNDAFITPYAFGSAKLQFNYDTRNADELLAQDFVYEGGIAFLIGRFTWVEFQYSSTLYFGVLAGFYF